MNTKFVDKVFRILFVMVFVMGMVGVPGGRAKAQSDVQLVSLPMGWFLNPANNHYYKLTDDLTWQDAETQAMNWGGHLVTVNDQAENDWLVSTFGSEQTVWIGYTDQYEEGNWVWANGETPGYTNWFQHLCGDWEPNDAGPEGEDFATFNYIGESGGCDGVPQGTPEIGPGKWNDIPVDVYTRGIVELTSPPPSPTVGLVVTEDGVDDQAFNMMAYQGLQQAEANLGIEGTLYEPASSDDYGSSLQQCVVDGNDLCFAVGFTMMDAIVNAANDYPGTSFAILDFTQDDLPSNLRGIRFDEKQVGYLAGALAGKMTGSHTIGAVGGMDIPPVAAFVEGYRNGAQCANPGVSVLVDYAGTFTDPGLGETMAQNMMGQGADVIFGVAGATGNGAILYSAQNGGWSIGVDSDQYLTVFGGGTVAGSDKLLTSAMKNLDFAIYQTIQDYVNESFSSGTVTYHLEDGGVGLAPYHETDASIPQITKEYVDGVRADIINGNIDINETCRDELYNPSFSARLAENQVHGYGWLIDSDVDLFINGEYFDTQTAVEADWDPNDTFVMFELGESLTLQAGQFIEMTDGNISKTHTVTNLDVTGIDPIADTVSGTADPDSQINVGISCEDCPGRNVIANTLGNWVADYSVWGDEDWEHNTFDIQPGDRGEAAQCDEDGDCTQFEWYLPNPHFTVYPEWEAVEAWEWPDGAPMTATVDGKSECVANGQSGYPEWDPWTTNVWMNFPEGCDVTEGDTVTVTDGETQRTHEVQNLTVTNVDVTANTVSGTAGVGTIVHVWPHCCGEYEVQPIAETDGHWDAVFPTEFNLQPGMDGRAEVRDANGNATAVDWHAPNPTFGIRTNEDNIEGWEWPLGATVTVEIAGFTPSEPITATVGVADWDPNQTYFSLHIEDYDLKTGDVVTVTDGNTIKELTITHFEITGYDLDTEMVYGEAGENQYVNVWTCWQNDPCIGRDETANEFGYWETDFSVSGEQDWEGETADLRAGSWIDSSVNDEDGDQIMFGVNVLNPHIEVLDYIDRIALVDWPAGQEVHVFIGEESSPVYEMYFTPDEDWGYYEFFADTYDIKMGDVITAGNGTLTKTLEVALLQATEIDSDNGIVYGEASPYSQFDMEIWGDHFDVNPVYDVVSVDEDGGWSADYSGVPGNLLPWTWLIRGRMYQSDEDGDVTIADWHNHWSVLEVWMNEAELRAFDWELGTTLTFTVHGSTPNHPLLFTETAQTAPMDWVNHGSATVSVSGILELQPGMIVTVTDGTVTKSTVIRDIGFNRLDPDNDVAGGFAPANAELDIVISKDYWSHRYFSADGNGDWIVDYKIPDPGGRTLDLELGDQFYGLFMRDDEFDSTVVSAYVPSPSFSARMTENQVHGYGWMLGSEVTLIINGEEIDTQTVIQADWDPSQTFVWFDLGGSHTLQAGQNIEMTDGYITKTHTVTNLIVTGADANADTVFGTADSGTQVDVGHIFCDESGCYGFRREFADSNGGWLADFSEPGEDDDEQDIIDITPGMSNEARQCDDDGDCTQYGWYAIWVAPDTVPLVIGINNDHDLNLPQLDIDTLTILNQLFEPPFRQMGDGTFMAGAATQYTVSPDGLVYTLTLRDMTWSDGLPVTAQHYVDGLLRLLDPASGYNYPSLYYPIAGARDYNQGLTSDPNEVGIRALDAHILELTLESRTVYFPQIMAFPSFLPVRLDLIAQYGDAWMEPENFVGNGPYLLIEHDAGHFLLDRNPYYYNYDQLQFTQVGFAIIPDDNERLDAYRRGDIDLVWTFPRYEYPNIINDPVLSQDIDISSQPGIQYLGLNVDRYPTDNVLVRMALASAVDRDYLIQTVIGAYWHTEATGVIPPEMFGYQGDSVGYTYNESQAQDYLAQAGFPGGAGFPEIKLISNTGHEDIVEYIAQQWRDVLGIPVSVEYFAWGDYLGMLNDCRGDPAGCEYNVYRLGWIADYTDPNNILADLFGPDSASQYTGWDDLRYRELLQLSSSEATPSQRLEYLHEAERILVEDKAAILPLYFTDRLSLVRSGILPYFGPLIANLNLWDPILMNQPPTDVVITAPTAPLPVHAPVTIQVDFADPDEGDTHTVEIDWGDSTVTVVEPVGLTVTATHQYQLAGVYTIIATVTDAAGESAQATFQYVVIYDPDGGFVTGGGWFNDPDTGTKAHFGFNPKYHKTGTLNGKVEFKLDDMKFRSTSLDWLVISGTKATLKGTGTINGAGEYKFILTAIDGSPDKFRIKIWDPVTDEVIYDSQPGDDNIADPTTAIQGGSIVIHKAK